MWLHWKNAIIWKIMILEAKNISNLKERLKFLKKQIKLNPDDIDLRLFYISQIEKPKKKMVEYDILVGDEYKKIDKTFLTSQDLTRIIKVCKSYILDAFKLGFINEGIDCGISCLKIDELDELNIRYLLVDELFKSNRLNDYYNYIQPFNTDYDLYSNLIFYTIVDDFDLFKEAYLKLNESNPNLIKLIKGELSDDESSNYIFNEYIVSYNSNKEKIKEFLKGI